MEPISTDLYDVFFFAKDQVWYFSVRMVTSNDPHKVWCILFLIASLRQPSAHHSRCFADPLHVCLLPESIICLSSVTWWFLWEKPPLPTCFTPQLPQFTIPWWRWRLHHDVSSEWCGTRVNGEFPILLREGGKVYRVLFVIYRQSLPSGTMLVRLIHNIYLTMNGPWWVKKGW